MRIEFLKEINELIIDSTLDESDEVVLGSIGKANYPTIQDIESAKLTVNKAIASFNKEKLENKRAEFEAHKASQMEQDLSSNSKTIPQMLGDIVAALRNEDKVPEGLLLAFREQSQGGSEEDLKELWISLVQLGLIDIKDDDEL